MSMISAVRHSVTDAFPQLLDGLRTEFGCSDVGALAEQFLDAEEADFHWQARVAERHLGQYCSADEGDEELDRIAIISFLAGRWHAACVIVDGDGAVLELTGLCSFGSYDEAEGGFRQAR
jgi:hypothetical protein